MRRNKFDDLPFGPTATGFRRRSIRDVLENPRESEYYVLVTRYYPMEFRRQSLKLEDTPIDEWDRDLAPSSELLRWWRGGSRTPGRWKEYTRGFLGEVPLVLIRRKAEIHKRRAQDKKVVFVCTEEDREYPYCHTWILLDVLEKMRDRMFDNLPFGPVRRETEFEAEIRRDVERIFEEKRRRLGVEARLDLHVETVEAPPIVGENVYGEAFPSERPPRVWLEVFPEATTREITKIVCEELLHVKHPGLSEGEIGRMVPTCVGEGGKRYSKETEEMLRSGRGYNCESYGEFYGPQPFKKVLEHEVEDMYNVHILEETCREMGIECRGLDDPANVRVCMEAAEREIERRFGAGSKAIWLGTRYDVRTRYCTPGEKPVQYAIPKGAMVMSDLGPDGTLFLFPRGEEKERTKDILKRAGYDLPPGPITACEARWSDEPNLLYPHSVVQLRPQAFLDLCPPLPYTHENLKSMVADVVGELKTKGRYKPFLKVNLSGQVLDHEGRIRAIAAKRLGCRKIPVEVYFYDEEYREYLEPPKKLPPLEPQRWREFHTRRGEPVPPVHTFYVAGLMVRMLGLGL